MPRNFAVRALEHEEYLIDFCLEQFHYSSFREFVMPRIRELVSSHLDLPSDFGMELADWVLCELIRLEGLNHLCILSKKATFDDDMTFNDWIRSSIENGSLSLYKTYDDFMIDFNKAKALYDGPFTGEHFKKVFDREDIYYV